MSSTAVVWVMAPTVPGRAETTWDHGPRMTVQRPSVDTINVRIKPAVSSSCSSARLLVSSPHIISIHLISTHILIYSTPSSPPDGPTSPSQYISPISTASLRRFSPSAWTHFTNLKDTSDFTTRQRAVFRTNERVRVFFTRS